MKARWKRSKAMKALAKRSEAERDAWRRKDYKRCGHSTYPTSVPCPTCGGWRRWVTDRACVDCNPRKGKTR
jgi:hypothetical protein